MKFSDRFITAFKTFLPAPFTIAVLLSLLTVILALTITSTNNKLARFEEITKGKFKLVAPEGKAYHWAPSNENTSSIIFDTATGDWCSVEITSQNNGYISKYNFGFNPDSGEVIVANDSSPKIIQLLNFWKEGLWKNGLIVFAFQMMLMLVLGHALALTTPVKKLITHATKYCNTTAKAAAIVSFLTILVGFMNWGLGLIFGAILARKVGESAQENGLKLNYPLIGAAGYVGLMVWHGGLSGSSLVKVAEPGHLKALMKGILPENTLANLPEAITFGETVFSPMNLTVSLLLLVLIPLAMFWLGKKDEGSIPIIEEKIIAPNTQTTDNKPKGAERLDFSQVLAIGVGLVIIGLCVLEALKPSNQSLGFITPNFINLSLLGLAITFHKQFNAFVKAIDVAIKGASGILIQFPLYFGIMGIMNASGLVNQFSAFFVQISNEVTYPLFTFLSAGLVNVFVPSGGGQWGVQGPIIVKAASEIGLSLPKSIMALAYGDQLTNMLQPFWALPLLGITGLSAKEILPYTLFLFLLGGTIFIFGLLIF